jgi:hypothetical protein
MATNQRPDVTHPWKLDTVFSGPGWGEH